MRSKAHWTLISILALSASAVGQQDSWQQTLDRLFSKPTTADKPTPKPPDFEVGDYLILKNPNASFTLAFWRTEVLVREAEAWFAGEKSVESLKAFKISNGIKVKVLEFDHVLVITDRNDRYGGRTHLSIVKLRLLSGEYRGGELWTLSSIVHGSPAD